MGPREVVTPAVVVVVEAAAGAVAVVVAAVVMAAEGIDGRRGRGIPRTALPPRASLPQARHNLTSIMR